MNKGIAMNVFTKSPEAKGSAVILGFLALGTIAGIVVSAIVGNATMAICFAGLLGVVALMAIWEGRYLTKKEKEATAKAARRAYRYGA